MPAHAIEDACPIPAHVMIIDGNKEESTPTVPLPPPNDGIKDIFLPKRIYIQDNQGRYLTLRSSSAYPNSTLTFQSGTPNLDCVFQTHGLGPSQYRLIARDRSFVMLLGERNSDDKWYSTEPDPEFLSPIFAFILASDNILYMQDRSYSRFMSNQLKATESYVGGPLALKYVNQDSEMKISIAAVKTEIIDIHYDIPEAVVRDAPPVIALMTSVQNNSSSSDTTQMLQYSYEKWVVGTWNNTAGIEIGAKTSFSAGVPFIASVDFEIVISASYSHEWGGEEGEREVVTSSTSIVVPPKKKAKATVIVRNAHLDVGFTYTERVFWSNGESEETKKTGIYRNVDSWHVDVEVSDWQDI